MESRQKLSHTGSSYPAILVAVLLQSLAGVSNALAAPTVANGNFDLGGNQWTVTVPATLDPWQVSFPGTGGNPNGFSRIQSPFGDSTGGVAAATGTISQVLGCTADQEENCEIIFDYKLDWFDATSGFDSGRIVARINGTLVFASAHNLSETNPGTPWTTVTLQAPVCDPPSSLITLALGLEVLQGDNAWVASFDNVRVNCDGSSSAASQYVRGDSNTDGVVDISDPQNTLAYLFQNGPVPPCLGAADANGDQEMDLSDAIYGLSFSFRGGPRPAPPYPDCGVGERDTLGCAVYEICPPSLPPVNPPGVPCRDLDEETMFSAAATRITFDAEEGRALHEVVVNQYQALGVSFVDDSVKTPLIVDTAIRGATTASPEYSLYNDNDFPSSSAGVPMDIRFTALVQRVGMYVGNGNNAGGVHATLTAYDVSNTSICSITRQNIPDGVHAFIGMDVGSALIERVELDYGAVLNGEEIDTLIFE